jgi:hypothetical protein
MARGSICCVHDEHRINSRLITSCKGTLMLKFVILSTASLAFVGTAVAADLPQPQPVVQAAPVGKWPGKSPIGKSPVGKYPIGKAPAPAPAPLVTKG